MSICLFSLLDEYETSGDNSQVDRKSSKVLLAGGNQSEQDKLIKTGEMTPFGGTVQSTKGRKELHDGITDCGHSSTDQKDGRDPGLDCSATQNIKACQANNKSLARSVTENLENDYNDDDVYDDEYVPDESELKYSWYENEDEEGTEREPGKAGKQTARKCSLNVVYRGEDSPKAKKKKRTNKSVRRTDCRPVDDGSEKVYRQRIR